MAFRPGKWLIYSTVGAILPFVAALAVNGPGLRQDLAARAGKNLENAGGTWATLAIAGRDATIAGESPSEELTAAAVKAVSETYGIRRVESLARVAEQPTPP